MSCEFDKMTAGELYNSFDTQLVLLRQRCTDILNVLNTLSTQRESEKPQLLATLFKSAIRSLTLNTPFSCEYGNNISIGEDCLLDYGCIMIDCAKIKIGNRCRMDPGVFITTAVRLSPRVERIEGLETALPVIIGDDAWLGAGVMVNPGVIIGNNVAIAPGSVVTRNIPSNCLAGGNPCRVMQWLDEADDGDIII